jgi:hypothetical protein
MEVGTGVDRKLSRGFEERHDDQGCRGEKHQSREGVSSGRITSAMETATTAASAKTRKAQFSVPDAQPRFNQLENGVHAGVSELLNQGTTRLAMSRTTGASDTTSNEPG